MRNRILLAFSFTTAAAACGGATSTTPEATDASASQANGAAGDTTSSASSAASSSSAPVSCPPSQYDAGSTAYPRCTSAIGQVCQQGASTCQDMCAGGKMLITCENDPTGSAGQPPEPDPSYGCEDPKIITPGGPPNGWRKCCSCAP